MTGPTRPAWESDKPEDAEGPAHKCAACSSEAPYEALDGIWLCRRCAENFQHIQRLGGLT